jgi:predicted O-methyltransferase YrrM
MRLFRFLLNSFLLISPLLAIDLSTLPDPYNSVNLMPFNSHGWHGNGAQLLAIIRTKRVKTIVEVGSWMGLSTRDMAAMLPEGGVIYAVDTWNGSPNEVHDPQILSTLYDQFLSNVIRAGLTHKIIPIRMDSQEAAATLTVCPDLVYIDATHTYEAISKDIESWWPFVRGHGTLCGDDWATSPGVRQAVMEFAKENDLLVEATGNFWCFHEKNS